MDWNEVKTVATNGSLSVKDWKSLRDGLWEIKENNFAKFKIYHKDNSKTLRFEFGIIHHEKVHRVKSYLEANPNKFRLSQKIESGANATVNINGTVFRIGFGPETNYIVFKPEVRKIQYIEKFDEKKLIQEFEKFKNDIINSGLDKLLTQIK